MFGLIVSLGRFGVALTVLMLFFINTVNATKSPDNKVHPQALDYCADLTLSKKILLGHYQSGDYTPLTEADLSQYDQNTCQQIITKLIKTETSLALLANPLSFAFHPDQTGHLLPDNLRTFDYSFICSSIRLTSITLSSADNWKVLACIKNKAQIQMITLSEFTYKPLDMRFLMQFPNLKILFLTQGKLKYTSALPHISSLNHLLLGNVNITVEQMADIAKLKHLKTLKIEHQTRFEVQDLTPLRNLKSLELVAIAFHGLDLKGLNEFTNLTHLNLQGSQVTDAAYTDILQLTQLQRLNLADNIGITTVAPLKYMANLDQLSISGTSVTDLAPLATHQGLFGQGYNISYNLHFDGSQVVDLTSYYAAGGNNSNSSELLGCSPTSRKEYLAGKRCNEQQRRECKMPGYGLIDYYISAPLCVWWYGD